MCTINKEIYMTMNVKFIILDVQSGKSAQSGDRK